MQRGNFVVSQAEITSRAVADEERALRNRADRKPCVAVCDSQKRDGIARQELDDIFHGHPRRPH